MTEILNVAGYDDDKEFEEMVKLLRSVGETRPIERATWSEAEEYLRQLEIDDKLEQAGEENDY